MDQMQLDVVAFMGWTHWQTGKPAHVGWYAARFVSQGQEEPRYNDDRMVRRWWNGSAWSGTSIVGMTDELMENAKNTASRGSPESIEYSGLLSRPFESDAPRVRERVRLEAQQNKDQDRDDRAAEKRGRVRYEEALGR